MIERATSPDSYLLGADIGGTNQTVALARSNGQVVSLHRRKLRSGGTARDVLANVMEMADEALAAAAREMGISSIPVLRFGVGFGGPVDYGRGMVLTSHHVAGWDGFPLASALTDRYGIPAVVDNDANAAALGEALFGAGKGAGSVLYVNIGTGIGAGVVLGGTVLRGYQGMAGEIGHVTVVTDGPACGCGKRGCLEALASGRSLGRRAQEAARQDPTRSSYLVSLAGGDMATLSGLHVLEAACVGDPVALELIGETADYLGLGLGNAVNLLDPQLIVIGGGVSRAGDILFAPLTASLQKHVMPGMVPPPIVAATLGYDAGVIGAIALALETAPRNGRGPLAQSFQ